MSSTAFRLSTATAAALLVATVAASAPALAGTPGDLIASLGSPIVSTGTLPIGGSAAGVSVGDGIHQSNPLINTFQDGKTPLVGVGALSGRPDHGGSLVSVSVLNSTRLVGVSAGPVGAGGVNVANPTNQPVLSGLIK